MDTRLSAQGWSKLASAIASLREFLNTVQHSFSSPSNASQMMNSLEHFQSNSETGMSIFVREYIYFVFVCVCERERGE